MAVSTDAKDAFGGVAAAALGRSALGESAAFGAAAAGAGMAAGGGARGRGGENTPSGLGERGVLGGDGSSSVGMASSTRPVRGNAASSLGSSGTVATDSTDSRPENRGCALSALFRRQIRGGGEQKARSILEKQH